MDLWRGPLPHFVELARSGRIATDMVASYYRRHGTPPGVSEIRSWENSLTALADVLRDNRLSGSAMALRSAGVASGNAAKAGLAAETASVVGMSTEYHLPLDNRRVDVLFFGHDHAARPRTLALELKQWSACDIEDEYTCNLLIDGREHPHPSQQALDYASWFTDYHSAFSAGDLIASSAAWCHNMEPTAAGPMRGAAFSELVARSPLFVRGEEPQLVSHLVELVGSGDGMEVLTAVAGGHFRPSAQVIETLEAILRAESEWHLLDEQRTAYNAIIAEVRRQQARRGRSVVLVRGGPGTGKTVIAIQLLADTLRLGLTAAHTTGGKAFTTVLRSKFRDADKLFRWNMNFAQAPTGALDLLLVDEAHRVRSTSNMRFTPRARRSEKSQFEELMDAAKVTVFFLDENQFVRPDEIGTTATIEVMTRKLGIPLKAFDLSAQFRCGGSAAYVKWVDWLLGFSDPPSEPFHERYTFELASEPEEVDAFMQAAAARGERTRLLAGFCWPWSDALADGSLVEDVRIGSWTRPWNAKASEKKSYRPDNHPYTLWATTEAGFGQVGCIYSAQGFEFDRVGVLWGTDLVWRSGAWVADRAASHDKAIKTGDGMLRLVRNAYRVLLTRGIRGTRVLCLDEETRAHVAACLAALGPASPGG
jgi:uncharacterized protein